MRTYHLCCCRLLYSSAEQIDMKIAFVSGMMYSQKTYSQKNYCSFQALFLNHMYLNLCCFSFQDSNSHWTYLSINISRVDYFSQYLSNALVWKHFTSSFNSMAQSKCFLHSFFLHSAYSDSEVLQRAACPRDKNFGAMMFSYGCCYVSHSLPGNYMWWNRFFNL